MPIRVMIVGGGRVGTALCRVLSTHGEELLVVDPRPERITAIRAVAPHARLTTAEPTDPAGLESAGIRTADVVAAVTADDARNLLVAALARLEFGVPRTLARVVDPAHRWLFEPPCGVDVALDQAELLTRLIAEEVSLGEVAILATLRRGDLRLVTERVAPGAPGDGRALTTLALPERCTIVAVLRDDEVRPAIGELVLQAGDEVLAVVPTGAVSHLGDLLAAGAAGHPSAPV